MSDPKPLNISTTTRAGYKDAVDTMLGYHPHLEDATILAVWHYKEDADDLGVLKPVPIEWWALTQADLLFIGNDYVWDMLTGEGRAALMDHHGSTIDTDVGWEGKATHGRRRYKRCDHGIVGVSPHVIARHPFFAGEIQGLKSMRDALISPQMFLFDDAKIADAAAKLKGWKITGSRNTRIVRAKIEEGVEKFGRDVDAMLAKTAGSRDPIGLREPSTWGQIGAEIDNVLGDEEAVAS